MNVTQGHDGSGPYTAGDLHAREDEGRGLELEDGWPTEVSYGTAHNVACRRVHEFVEAATKEAGAAVYTAGGGSWQIGTPAGVRRPDVFVVPTRVIRDSFADPSWILIPGRELLLVVEVVLPGTGSERTDRVRKVEEYAALGIPQYWIVDYTPVPKVQVFLLDDLSAYRLERVVTAGEVLEVEAEAEADKPFTVRFDPQALTEF
ncbi:Uma2 family endonuclease [Actinomadura terrae]|uniref:Uma2 family endonuclease n=1 Tax=Actinomadura terrae TaxID=604353 RepID=UPI001FA716CF|nr:Uma2 family endonuclease [Actinomadura terrae]